MTSDRWPISDPTRAPGLDLIRKIAPFAVERKLAYPPLACREHKHLRAEQKLDRSCMSCRFAGWQWLAELFHETTWSFGHALNAAEMTIIHLSRENERLRATLADEGRAARGVEDKKMLTLIQRLEAERDEYRARALAAETALVERIARETP